MLYTVFIVLAIIALLLFIFGRRHVRAARNATSVSPSQSAKDIHEHHPSFSAPRFGGFGRRKRARLQSQLVADASHRVADATETLGDIASAAIDVGGSAAGVIADNTVRGARMALIATPGVVGVVKRHPFLVASGAAIIVACFVLSRRRRHSGNEATEYTDRPVPRGVSAVA